ncbi:MAG: YceD family protein [Actinomycetaceae bacterium]|nr:YceD family protein [Actinomycetaceae bacterium]
MSQTVPTHDPLRLSIHDLPHQAGAHKDFLIDFVADQEWNNGVVFPQRDTAMKADVSMTSVGDGVLIHLRTSVPTTTQCGRCLDPVTDEIDIDLQEVFFSPELRQAALDEGDEDAEDMRVIEQESVDLSELLRDNLVLSMPFQPLCDPECLGLCPGCGMRMEDAEEGHAHEVIDPRWAALSAWKTEENDE